MGEHWVGHTKALVRAIESDKAPHRLAARRPVCLSASTSPAPAPPPLPLAARNRASTAPDMILTM